MIPSPPVGRRRALRLGLVGAALLSLGGGAAAWVTAGYDALLDPADLPVALSPKELAVVRALVEALFPGEGAFPPGLAIGLHQRVDEEVWSASEPTRSALKDAIQLLEHLPPLYGHAHRFTALSPAARLEVFGAMLRSKSGTVRQIAIAMKQMTHLFYYADARAWASIHYDGPFVEEPRPPASSVAYAAILKIRRGA
ncbi:MAG: hypothetical protein IT372_26100 [Polyangiaceae bacterium]|nr:hypothetical protein [Polyangiaceae bacterium]